MDLVKFAKLMELSASPVDGECLNAIRMANKILAESNISWSEFISQKTFVIQEVVTTSSQVQQPRDTNVETMLTECLSKIRSPSGKSFIVSLNDWYTKKGFLTEKQKEALIKWYDNI